MKKQSSVEWLVEQIKKDLNLRLRGFDIDKVIEQAKAMHKEEVKMIIEHYHNKMFYLELKERELENITEMIYNEKFE